jgi:hypothetical protein
MFLSLLSFSPFSLFLSSHLTPRKTVASTGTNERSVFSVFTMHVAFTSYLREDREKTEREDREKQR